MSKEPRQCEHCGATEDDGAELHEAYCGYGQGILHCEECAQTCNICGDWYCAWDLGFVEFPDGILNICEGCKGEENQSD